MRDIGDDGDDGGVVRFIGWMGEFMGGVGAGSCDWEGVPLRR